MRTISSLLSGCAVPGFYVFWPQKSIDRDVLVFTWNSKGLSMTVRKVLLAVMMVAAVALGACSPEDPFVQTPINKTTVKNPAFLRVIHAAADAPAVDVLVGDSLFFPQAQGFLSFATGGNEARYYRADTSAKTIVFKAGATILADTELSLTKGGYYSAYLYGRAGNYKVLVTTDTLFPTPSNGQARMRAVNLSPDAPPFTINLASLDQPPIFTDVASGTASSYTTTQSYPFNPNSQPSLWVRDDKGNLLFKADKIVVPGASVLTLLVTGNTYPKGEEPFLSLSPFIDNSRVVSGGDTLYGIPPLFQVKVAAVAFVSLVPTASLTADSALDVAFYDPEATDYAANEFFRRSYGGQYEAMFNVRPLPIVNLGNPIGIRPHLLLDALNEVLPGRRGYNPYRIEVNQNLSDSGRAGRNPIWPLVPSTSRTEMEDLFIEAGKRYTIVAYGPFVRGEANSVVLKDNSPLPSAGNASVRLFHGAFGEYQGKQLKLRINGIEGKPIGYGAAPTATDAFEVPAGDNLTLEAVDETGTVIHAETSQSLKPGTAYTVFLSRGAYHETPILVLTPVSQDIRFR
jgi:hypothetical protein